MSQEYNHTLKKIAEITGKSNTALFSFIKENSEFITEHSQKNGRFVKYDDEALQKFIMRFGRVDNAKAQVEAQEGEETPSNAPEVADTDTGSKKDEDAKQSVIEAFEAQIEALKKERDELASKLEARERDCADWRTQAGQALSALSKEQDRVELLEERLAGYLPPPPKETENATSPQYVKRKLTFSERIKALFGHELEIK